MKIKFLTFGMLLLLSFSLVLAAPAMPYVVHGNIVSGEHPLLNAELSILNVNTKQSSLTHTNENGFFQFDLANVDQNYRAGDTLKLALVYCAEAPECQRTLIVDDGAGIRIKIDVQTIVQPLPSDVIVVKFQCADGSFVDDSVKCPALIQPQPEVIKEPVIEVQVQCLNGSLVADISECPEESNNWVAMIIGILVLLFGGAGGFKFYNGKFKHLHRGLVGYHDPNTEHSNLKYRHRTWKQSPLGCIKDVKKIEKGIDLRGGN